MGKCLDSEDIFRKLRMEIMGIVVELRAAKIPVVGWLAVHYWYVILESQTAQRWEVWQRRHLKPESWGHLHKNLMSPQAGVGNGPSWLAQSWSGPDGDRLGEIIINSPQTYPHGYCYRYWPGPNSNTYAQWVLSQAGVDFDLGWRGVGRGYQPIVSLFSHANRQLER